MLADGCRKVRLFGALWGLNRVCVLVTVEKRAYSLFWGRVILVAMQSPGLFITGRAAGTPLVSCYGVAQRRGDHVCFGIESPYICLKQVSWPIVTKAMIRATRRCFSPSPSH